MRVHIYEEEEGKPVVEIETNQPAETATDAAKAYKEVKKELAKEGDK